MTAARRSRKSAGNGGAGFQIQRFFLATLRRCALLRVPSFFSRPLTAVFFSGFEAALPARAPAIKGIKGMGIYRRNVPQNTKTWARLKRHDAPRRDTDSTGVFGVSDVRVTCLLRVPPKPVSSSFRRESKQTFQTGSMESRGTLNVNSNRSLRRSISRAVSGCFQWNRSQTNPRGLAIHCRVRS